MLRFIMLVGIPGAGKSAYAKRIAEAQKTWSTKCPVIISSDAIREELYGDESIQGDSKEVFALMRKRTIENLKLLNTVIYDATNLTPKSRRGILTEVMQLKTSMAIKNRTNIFISCRVIATPLETCLVQNSMRSRKVPEEVILRMVKSFRCPLYSEGFDAIQFHYAKPEYEGCYGKPEDVIKELNGFGQNNPWHPEDDLGVHTRQVVYFLDKLCASMSDTKKIPMKEAGYLHDIGKPACETKDEEGISHYYGHASYGAYLSMNFKDNCMFRCQIISYHMDAHQWEKNPEAANKFKNLNPQLYEVLKLFAKADSEAVIPGFLEGE